MIRFVFVDRQNGPERLICEAEMHFSGPENACIDGMKLVGFSLWKSAEGETYVTFPSRSFGVGGERRFFDYLRSSEGLPTDGKRLKAEILYAYEQAQAGTEDKAEPLVIEHPGTGVIVHKTGRKPVTPQVQTAAHKGA